MCKASPGPRCSRHAQQQWERSRNKLADLRAAHAKVTSEIDDAINKFSYLSDEEIDSLRARQQELQEQIEDQIDRVAADRDDYWTTPRGRDELSAQIERYRVAGNMRAVNTLTVRLEQAKQEYEHRLLAGKIAEREKEQLKKSVAPEDYRKYVSSTTDRWSELCREEFIASMEVKHWRQKVAFAQDNPVLLQQIRSRANAAEARLLNAQAQRKQVEKEDHARRAGIKGFTRLKDATEVSVLNSGQCYLHLRNSDFGIARDHFPTGALVKIVKSRKDEVGNTVVELETGNERLLYSDSVVVKAS